MSKDLRITVEHNTIQVVTLAEVERIEKQLAEQLVAYYDKQIKELKQEIERLNKIISHDQH